MFKFILLGTEEKFLSNNSQGMTNIYINFQFDALNFGIDFFQNALLSDCEIHVKTYLRIKYFIGMYWYFISNN